MSQPKPIAKLGGLSESTETSHDVNIRNGGHFGFTSRYL